MVVSGRVRTRPDRGGCYAGNIPPYCIVAEFIGVALFAFLGGGCDANSVSNGELPANSPFPRNSCRGTLCRQVRSAYARCDVGAPGGGETMRCRMFCLGARQPCCLVQQRGRGRTVDAAPNAPRSYP